MGGSKSNSTAEAFRRALEERLKKASLMDQIDFNDLRHQVAFHRLMAGLFQEEPAPWSLKGGYKVELRLRVSRSTMDVDLTLQQS